MEYTKLNNTYFCEPKSNLRDRIQVEVGDSKQAEFFPQVKMMRWDNEVNLSLRLVQDERDVAHSLDKEIIVFQGNKQEVRFYEILEDEGRYEFEIILKEKPTSNRIDFTMQHKGVRFAYQPFLANENSDGSTWEYLPGTENICTRPAEVNGSYVVHTVGKKLNFAEGKQYRTGKVGHIFRPRLEDASGKQTWGELFIDEKSEILSVTIPQKFLDNATYPIFHASGLTIGYSTQGGSNVGFTNIIVAGRFASPGAGNANPGTFYGCYSGASGTVLGGAYVNNGGTVAGQAKLSTSDASITASTAKAFYSAAITWPNIAASTDYFLATVTTVSNLLLYYDTVTPGYEDGEYRTATTNLPDPFGTPTTPFTGEFSIYVVYDAAAGGGSIPGNPFRKPFVRPFGGVL